MIDEAARKQLCASGATFCVKFVGQLELPKTLRGVDEDHTQKIAHSCAMLIGQKAEYDVPISPIDPSIEEYLGDMEPRIVNKEIELTITNRIVTFVCILTNRLLRKIDMSNISMAMIIHKTIENGFVFCGKVKTGDIFKRYCFLCIAPQDPENIYHTFQVAFGLCKQAIRKPPPVPPRTVIKRITESDWRDIPLNLTGIHIAAKPYLYPKTDVIPPPISDEVLEESLGSLKREIAEKYSLYEWVDDSSKGESNNELKMLNVPITPERFKVICHGLDKEPWFFDRIHRDEAEKMLERDGAFLVRISETKPMMVILTVRYDRNPHHIILNDEFGNVSSLRIFPTILHLMCYHYRNNIPFTTADEDDPIQVHIKYPMSRETSIN
uniref:SH2 domain-containing protein n=1 Tax=Panagrolaimus sp. JU765 TaxID=591449 RepID=A0AC34RRB8_9BILA